MTTVLAAVDNSAASNPVIGMAMLLAPVLGSTSKRCTSPKTDGDTARASAAALSVPFRTVHGEPLEQLLALISADSVVAAAIGARGLPGRRPPGHLALALADCIDKPLLVVPPDSRTPDALRRVLIAMEGTASRPQRLERALQLVDRLGLDVTVVHVDHNDSIPSFSDQVQHETDAYADAFLARYAAGLRRAQLELRIGDPAEEILEAAESIDADIVATGWPAGAGADHGLIAREVLGRNRRATLLVPIG